MMPHSEMTPETAVRIMIVDPQLSLREMLAETLARDAAFEIVGQAGNGCEAVALSASTRPDVVIMDLRLPDLPGPAVVERLRLPREDGANCRVLIYASTQNRDLIAATLRAGSAGFVHRREPLRMLRLAVVAVSQGASYFSPTVSDLLFDDRATQTAGGLSGREREILCLVASGLTSKTISSRLGVATRTVENHRARLKTKLGLRGVAALTRYAVQVGLVPAA